MMSNDQKIDETPQKWKKRPKNGPKTAQSMRNDPKWAKNVFFGTNSPNPAPTPQIDQWSPPMMSSDQKILTPQKTAQKRPENGPKWKIAPKWAKNGFLAQTPCEKFWFFGKSSIYIKSWRNNRIQISYLHLGLRLLWGRCALIFVKCRKKKLFCQLRETPARTKWCSNGILS